MQGVLLSWLHPCEIAAVTAPCPIFGFLVEFDIGELRADQSDALWNEFMQLVEQRGLLADGGSGRHQWTYRIHSEASQATDMDRTSIETWAASRREILAARVGALFDIQAL